jgi:hypothetical protein
MRWEQEYFTMTIKKMFGHTLMGREEQRGWGWGLWVMGRVRGNNKEKDKTSNT